MKRNVHLKVQIKQLEKNNERIESLNKDFEKYMNDSFMPRQNGRWEDLKKELNEQRIKLEARLENGLNAIYAKSKLEDAYRALPADLPPQEQDKIVEFKKAQIDEIEALLAKNIEEIDKPFVPSNVSPPEALSGEREESIEKLAKSEFEENMSKMAIRHYSEWIELEKQQKYKNANMDPSDIFNDRYPSDPFNDINEI